MPLPPKFAGTLGAQHAAHLLRRTTFGPTSQDISEFSSYNIDQAINVLFASIPDPADPIDPKTGASWVNPMANGSNSSQDDLYQYFMAWHLELMRTSGTNIRERIVWFLHSHLPTKISKAVRAENLYYQNKLYRYYALGSFKTLFRKWCADNANLHFLDNDTNDKDSPNENFAREMMELYSIGRGEQKGDGDYTNYTEVDVKAATRVLTGYQTTDGDFLTLDQDNMIPAGELKSASVGGKEVANRHDPSKKQFSYAFNNLIIEPDELSGGYATVAAAEGELDELINMLFDQDATAEFITRKIYRFFVYYIIDDTVETNIIKPLAQDFKSNNYDLPRLIKNLLSSQHFFDTDNGVTDDNISGAIIKSPVDLVMGVCRLFNVTFPADTMTLYSTVYKDGLIDGLIKQGVNLYEPFEVAGYPAYFQVPNYNRNWITPYYMAYRYQFADLIFVGKNYKGDDLGIQLDVLSWVKDTNNVSDPSDAEALVDRLIELMYPFPVDDARKNYFLTDVFLEGYANAGYWTQAWNDYLANPSASATVYNNLKRLLVKMMQSPEFQLI